jgi:cyclopropane fatty-acyl-phospholipid synthase-like methyltransferase
VNNPRLFPDWEELYRSAQGVERLPWYWPTLDPDLEDALARHGIPAGRLLDQGTGPGTQAIALAERRFEVTATDVSHASIAYAERQARARGARITFVQDDVLATKLTGPFDVVFDRGCFHVLAPEHRPGYAETMHRLLAPAGWLFVKTFSHEQPGEQGPYRFTPDELRRVFGAGGRFEIVEILDTIFQGQLDPYPRALFCAMRRRG